MAGSEEEAPLQGGVLGRGVMGGILMGMANLVPGISGGTMLLAAGVYPDFIQAIADLSRFKISVRALAVLGVVGCSAVLSILLGAGTVKDLVLEHRWIMYSLFIGLTLGGIPVIWRLIGKPNGQVWGGAVVGFLGMAGLAIAQANGMGTGTGTNASIPLMFAGGIAGASAMILPGVSGGYLLLVMGLYVPILSGIDTFKDALKAMDIAAMMDPVMTVVAPVGIGVLVGVIGVSNLLKWLLAKFQKATLGVLLGLLVGAVVGLWPFQHGVAPDVGDVVKGRVMTTELIAELDAEDYPVVWFTPSAVQVVGSLGLLGLGLGITGAVAYVGRRKEEDAHE